MEPKNASTRPSALDIEGYEIIPDRMLVRFPERFPGCEFQSTGVTHAYEILIRGDGKPDLYTFKQAMAHLAGLKWDSEEAYRFNKACEKTWRVK